MKKKLPTAQLLPSGMYRCRVMVDGERVSVVDTDPDICQAKAYALKSGMIERKNNPAPITIEKAMEKYIEVRNNVLSTATIRAYKNVSKNYFKQIKSKKLSSIDETIIQSQINLYAKDKSYKTVKNAVSFLVSVVSEDHPINVKRLKYPQRIPKEHSYLEADSITKLIDVCCGDVIEIPVLMALWLGMRRSEICALDWSDIDFENKTVSITKSKVPDEDNKFVIKNTTKTEKSRRILNCPDYILERLKASQPDESKRTGQIVKLHPNDIYNHLKVVCDNNGIPFVGVHGLRHTNASVMLSLGVADKIAMARGGWSSRDTMQNIYQHLFKDDKSAADTAINGYFDDLISKNGHEFGHEKQRCLEPQSL